MTFVVRLTQRSFEEYSAYMATDWTNIYKNYKGLWVALLDDEVTVVGSGKTLKEAAEEAEKKGYTNPIFFRVPTEVLPYIGGFRLS